MPDPQLSLFDTETIPKANPERTLLDAQLFIDDHKDAGVSCPCCGQLVRLYRRTIHAQMARWLILLCKISGPELQWVDQLDLPARGGDFAKLRHWGLVEQAGKDPGDASRRTSGIWRPTLLGYRFARGDVTVPKFAYLYLNRCLGNKGPPVNVDYCLGKQFDYSELWAS